VELRRLKDETIDLHVEAERHVRILDADATAATYGRYLARLLGVHAPMEAAFCAHEQLAAIGFEPERRRRAGLLSQDLASLGMAPANVPHCDALPEIADVSRALGADPRGGRVTLDDRQFAARFVEAQLAGDRGEAMRIALALAALPGGRA